MSAEQLANLAEVLDKGSTFVLSLIFVSFAMGLLWASVKEKASPVQTAYRILSGVTLFIAVIVGGPALFDWGLGRTVGRIEESPVRQTAVKAAVAGVGFLSNIETGWGAGKDISASDGGTGLGDVVDEFVEEVKSAVGGAAAVATPVASGSAGTSASVKAAGDATWGAQVVSQAASAAAAAVTSAENVMPAAQPTAVVGVHAAEMGTNNSNEGIDAQAKSNAAVAAEAAADGTPLEDLNGNSENLMFGLGGGGQAGEADIAACRAAKSVMLPLAYTVQSGDSVAKLAAYFYCDATEYMQICRANFMNVSACGKIRRKQVLQIPVFK